MIRTPSDAGAVHPTPTLLGDFLELADASPKKLEDFARTWGGFDVCEHGLYWKHAPYYNEEIEDEEECDPLRDVSDEGTYNLLRTWAPAESWRHLARQLGAVLRIADRLRDNRPGETSDWHTLFEWTDPSFLRESPEEFYALSDFQYWIYLLYTERVQVDHETGRIAPPNNAILPILDDDIGIQQHLLAYLVSEWLSWGRTMISLDWQQSEPILAIAVSDVFGALIAQTLMTIGRRMTVYLCSGCGTPFFPSRPGHQGRHYCKRCGRSTATRDAMRDFRQRNRKGR